MNHVHLNPDDITYGQNSVRYVMKGNRITSKRFASVGEPNDSADTPIQTILYYDS